jgi:hypothetical protein
MGMNGRVIKKWHFMIAQLKIITILSFTTFGHQNQNGYDETYFPRTVVGVKIPQFP